MYIYILKSWSIMGNRPKIQTQHCIHCQHFSPGSNTGWVGLLDVGALVTGIIKQALSSSWVYSSCMETRISWKVRLGVKSSVVVMGVAVNGSQDNCGTDSNMWFWVGWNRSKHLLEWLEYSCWVCPKRSNFDSIPWPHHVEFVLSEMSMTGMLHV